MGLSTGIKTLAKRDSSIRLTHEIVGFLAEKGHQIYLIFGNDGGHFRIL